MSVTKIISDFSASSVTGQNECVQKYVSERFCAVAFHHSVVPALLFLALSSASHCRVNTNELQCMYGSSLKKSAEESNLGALACIKTGCTSIFLISESAGQVEHAMQVSRGFGFVHDEDVLDDAAQLPRNRRPHHGALLAFPPGDPDQRAACPQTHLPQTEKVQETRQEAAPEGSGVPE